MGQVKPVVDTPKIQEVEVSTGGPSWDFDKSVGGDDPFMSKVDDLKTLEGFSPAFKKSMTRDIIKFQRGDGAGTKQKTDTLFGTGYWKLDVANPPYNLDYLGKLYEVNATHKAAVDAKVSNIVGLGFDLVESHTMRQKLQTIQGNKSKLETARRKIDQEKNNVYEWIDNLNEEETFIETLSRVWTDVETMGNGYLEISRKVNGQIGYIGHVPAQTIRVRIKRDGFLQMVGSEVVFFRNYGDQKTTNPIGNDRRPSELIHFKKYSPTNGYYGVPDIMAAKNALAGAEFASRFNLDYFEHKAVPRYIIVVKGATLSGPSEQKLIDFFQTGLKGKNHRSMYVPLPPGSKDNDVSFEMNAVEAGVQEASFGSYLEHNRDEILAAHRVPLTKISLGGAALAAARDADKTFKETVCRPSQRTLEKKINKIFEEVTEVLRLRLNELTLTDEVEQAKIDEIYLRMQTVVPNEIRRRRGDPGLPDGDKVVDLKAQDAAEQTAQANGNRTRDQTRQSNATDSRGQARNPQGAGRTTS